MVSKEIESFGCCAAARLSSGTVDKRTLAREPAAGTRAGAG